MSECTAHNYVCVASAYEDKCIHIMTAPLTWSLSRILSQLRSNLQWQCLYNGNTSLMDTPLQSISQ